MRLKDAEEHLIKVLAVENVVARKGFVHKNVVGSLAKCHYNLKLIFLSCRKAPYWSVLFKVKKFHKPVKSFLGEIGEMLAVKFLVSHSCEIWEK